MKALLGGILLVLGALPAGATQVDFKEAKITRHSLKTIALALDKYRKLCGAFPITEEGLDALRQPLKCGGGAEASKPLLAKLEEDAWGHPFVYESDGRTFKVTSLGRDAKPGGTGLDADIEVSR